MKEKWKDVVGYEGLYEVSDQGNVRSVDRIIVSRNGVKRPVAGRPLRGGGAGHRHVTLFRDGIRTLRLIHHLVLEAFVGPRPEGFLACHGVNGHLDNSLQNLYWATQSQNLGADRLRDNTLPWGERGSKAKLTEDNVYSIRRRLKLGETHASIASRFGVHKSAIGFISRRENWKHLKEAE